MKGPADGLLLDPPEATDRNMSILIRCGNDAKTGEDRATFASGLLAIYAAQAALADDDGATRAFAYASQVLGAIATKQPIQLKGDPK